MPSISDLRRQSTKVRETLVRTAVDELCTLIENRQIRETEAQDRAGDVRFHARLLIPERLEQFDRLYQARFERLIEQYL